MTDIAATTPDTSTATSLDDLRLRLAPLIADAAVFDGWSGEAVKVAAEQAGVDADVAAYAFRGGAMEMIEAWTAAVDASAGSSSSGSTPCVARKRRCRVPCRSWRCRRMRRAR
jgi:hypothetical protein